MVFFAKYHKLCSESLRETPLIKTQNSNAVSMDNRTLSSFALFSFRKTIRGRNGYFFERTSSDIPKYVKNRFSTYFNPESNASVENVFVVIGNPQVVIGLWKQALLKPVKFN